MNLHELRTSHPLRDSDFAAIRARVKAEIAQREERPWLAMLLRLAVAASLLVLFVPYVQDRTPNVPVTAAAVRSAERRLPAGRSAAFQAAGRDVGEPAARMAALRKPAVRKPRKTEQHAEATRIEIITADPTIRIIWITPKENS